MAKRLFTRRRIKALLALLALAFVGLNAVAFMHARAMTRFVSSGDRTPSPEQLSFTQKLEVLLTGVKLPRPANRKTPADHGLAFETQRFPGAFKTPLEAWWIPRTNSRAVVVMFHGYGGSKEGNLPAAKIIYELGYDTLLIDFHGSGGSGGSTTSVGFHEGVDVQRALEHARRLAGAKPVVLFGTSMGAAAILKAVHDGAKPSAVILECPFDRMLSTVKNRFKAMRVPSFPAAQLLVFWGGRQQGFDGFAYNPEEYASSVTCPTLLLHGDHDARVSVPEVQSIHDHLAGAKTFLLVKNVGHECYALARPDEWQNAVASFLSNLR